MFAAANSVDEIGYCITSYQNRKFGFLGFLLLDRGSTADTK
jgi:hypothetical protein